MTHQDHIVSGTITGAPEGLLVTGPTNSAVIVPWDRKPTLRLFINEQGQVDAEYDNLSEAAQALIDEVRSKWVDSSKLKL